MPENRWWGCEVRFGSGCDDLFGVDHNKQMVSYFSRADAGLPLKATEESRQQTLDDLGVGENDVYADGRRTLEVQCRAMMGEIQRMFAARPGRGAGPNRNGEGLSVEQTAVSLTTGASPDSPLKMKVLGQPRLIESELSWMFRSAPHKLRTI